MKRPTYMLVDLTAIRPTEEEDTYSTLYLHQLAVAIVSAECLPIPIPVEEIAPFCYRVICNNELYFAAMRAKVLNPRLFETIDCFVFPEGRQYQAVEMFQAFTDD